MVKRCKHCRRFVAGVNGLCHKCSAKVSKDVNADFETVQNEKRGIFSSTLNDF